jgi:Serine/threonine protein kinase
MASNSEFLSCYVMKEMIGKGAFGTVWKAEDNSTHANVAVKVIDRRYVCIYCMYSV